MGLSEAHKQKRKFFFFFCTMRPQDVLIICVNVRQLQMYYSYYCAVSHYAIRDCKLTYSRHLILFYDVLLPSLRKVSGSISVYLVQWWIHSGDHSPRPILQLYFPTRFATFVASSSFCYQQKLLKLGKMAILQKQTIIEGD